MKLASFEIDRIRHIGAMEGESRLVDLTGAGMTSDMLEFIDLGRDGLAQADGIVADPESPRIDLDRTTLLPPIPAPRRNIFCVGKNYHEHVGEFEGSGFDRSATGATPEYPVFFSKPPSSVIGHGQPIPSENDPTNSMDYEGELGVVIGARGKRIRREDAMSHVYGYTVINDVTARTLQKDHQQWFLGKSPDGFCPMGPYLVTAEEVGDLAGSNLETRVNGEVRQATKIERLIFDIPALIESISRCIELLPGDVFATGTPAGVGIGFDPPVYLTKGDIVRISIDKVGTLENVVG